MNKLNFNPPHYSPKWVGEGTCGQLGGYSGGGDVDGTQSRPVSPSHLENHQVERKELEII